MKRLAVGFAIALTLSACAREPYLVVTYDPAQAMADMQARLEAEGYTQVRLVEALPSPGTNPVVYEGVAVSGSGKPFNFVIMADGSLELLPFKARQNLPGPPQYTCRQSGSSMQICVGAR